MPAESSHSIDGSGRHVEFCRILHGNGLMRAIVVVDMLEGIKFFLLLEEVKDRGSSYLLLKGQVHAFMPAILLWISRLDSLDGNAEPKPPDT